MKFPAWSHLAGVVCDRSCVRVRFSNTPCATLRSILRRAIARAYESVSPTHLLQLCHRSLIDKMLHRPFVLGHSLGHGSQRLSFQEPSPKTFQSTRVSIETFIPQSLERVPQKFTFWGIQRRTGTDPSLQLEKGACLQLKKRLHGALELQLCSSTLNLRNIPWARRFVRTKSMRVSAPPEMYVGAGQL